MVEVIRLPLLKRKDNFTNSFEDFIPIKTKNIMHFLLMLNKTTSLN